MNEPLHDAITYAFELKRQGKNALAWLDLWLAGNARARASLAAWLSTPHITCSRCGITSYNAQDIEQGYCGLCHDWTGGAVSIDAAKEAVVAAAREWCSDIDRAEGLLLAALRQAVARLLAAEVAQTQNPRRHAWGPSRVGHGEAQCTRCRITNREAIALGQEFCNV